jgi:NHLM bacteriocin system ABC transporter ATP-binding protein
MSRPESQAPLGADLLRSLSTLAPAGSDQPYLLDHAGAWLVETGRLDLFLVALRDGQPVGTRTHLTRIGAGQALFGAPVRDDRTLLAVGSADTTVWTAPEGAFAPLVAHADAADALPPLVDGWVEALCRAAAGERGPKRFTDLATSGEFDTTEAQPIRPAAGVLWLSPRTGVAHVLGDARLVVTTEDPLPLSGDAWLTLPAAGGVRARATADMLRDGRAWDGLEDLHHTILGHCARRVEHAAALEQERLLAKGQALRSTLAGAVMRLAATIAPERRRRGPRAGAPLAGANDALFVACTMVGEALGIPMVRDAGSRAMQKDPLNAIASASRVRTRRVSLRDRWWREENGPLLAWRAESMLPVALLPAPGGYTLHDPATGEASPVTAEVAAGLHGLATAFYRSFPEHSLTVPDVLRFGLFGTRRDLFMVAAMGGMVGILGMVTPLATSALFNTIIPGAERGQLLQLSLVLLVCAGAAALFQVVRSVALLRIEARMGAAIQTAVWDRLLDLPMPFFRPYSAGDLAVRAMGIDEIRRAFSGAAITALISGLFSSFNFVLLFMYDVRLALWATLLIVGALTAMMAASLLQLRHQRATARLRSKTSGLVLQLLSGIAKLKTVGAEVQGFDVWSRLFSEQRMHTFRARTVANGYAAFNAIFPVVAAMVIFANAPGGAQGHTLGTGDFLAFIAAFNICLGATLATGSAMMGLLQTVPLYEQAKPILHTSPEVDRHKANPGELTGAIDLHSVFFRYRADGPHTLHDFSVRIAPGDFVAFVGPSGSGKSTVMRLLLGFETPESGAVSYDQQDLSGLDVQALRRQIGVVLQNGRLMTGDLFTNIVGSSTATLDDAWEAAAMAGLEADIREMPMGMHTVVSEGGGTLSGGQRQRLMIARAIVNRPRILLFDEATSALDNRTQAIVSRSLEKLSATRIVIAHRLSTIVHATKIYVVQAGHIVEGGTYDELMQRNGLFTELARRQLA